MFANFFLNAFIFINNYFQVLKATIMELWSYII